MGESIILCIALRHIFPGWFTCKGTKTGVLLVVVLSMGLDVRAGV